MKSAEFCLTESPFAGVNGKSKVFVEHGADPYQNTLSVLKNFDLTPASGKKVLLKPNVGRIALPGAAVTTNPQVVAAAIDAFREAGAEVAIGESPISGVKTMEAFEATGIAGVAAERDCPLIDMDERPFVKINVPDGKAINSLNLCPDILEYDIIVSIPVIKMHMHTGATLAVKNMKGCLWRRSKVVLHMLPPCPEYPEEKPINVAIADMAGILRPHFSIIDGSFCMEGLGPSAGVPRKLDLVLAGVDAFATDSVACELMGITAYDVPHLRLGGARGYGETDLTKIEVFPENWRDYAEEFALPPKNISIDFPDVTILDKNSCSACQSTLLLFLKRYGDQLKDYFPEGNINIAIGKGHDDLPEGTLCIGNCTVKHKDKGIFVKGCPPVGSEILCKISGNFSYDTKDGHSDSSEDE